MDDGVNKEHSELTFKNARVYHTIDEYFIMMGC